MALFSVIKADVDDLINTNGIQAITGAIHNGVLNDLIDAVGAAQVYINPAVTDNPGTPQNNRAYIALPGTYTNFGNLTITAPLGVLSWNGTAWSVTQIAMPSPYNYFRCKLTAALTQGTPYTTASIATVTGGWTANAGEFVQIIDRRTGKFDFVQLTAAITPASTSMSFVSRTILHSFSVGSIIELYPTLNMRWHCNYPIPTVVGATYFFILPSDWRMPNASCTDSITYLKNLEIVSNGFRLRWEAGTGTPSSIGKYRIDSSNRLKIWLFEEMVEGENEVKYWQPAVLEEYVP